MKMPISEIIDRYTITKLKSERTNEDVSLELEAYKIEIDKYDTDLSQYIQLMYNVNSKIWNTEGDIRKGTRLVNECLTYKRFTSKVKILHHPTTITKRYQPTIHCGPVSQCARIIDMNKDYLNFFDCAYDLKCTFILATIDDDDENRVIDKLNILSEMAKDRNMSIEIEFVPWLKINNITTAYDLIKKSKAKNLGIAI